MLQVTLVHAYSPDIEFWKFLDSIIIDTIEGFSSFVWSPIHVPAYGKESEFWYLPVDPAEGYEFWVTDKEDGEQYLLTSDKLVKGFNKWANWCIENQNPVLYPGCSEWDCICADQVVQFAIFGELVYG